MRLVPENNQGQIIKDTVSTGRVEMCLNGEFTTICDDSWDNVDASVLCKELGFSEHGMYMLCLILRMLLYHIPQVLLVLVEAYLLQEIEH